MVLSAVFLKALTFLAVAAAAWFINDLTVLYYLYDPQLMNSSITRLFSDRPFKLRFTEFLEDLFKMLYQGQSILPYTFRNGLSKAYFMVVRYILDMPLTKALRI